jgi:hypothetical protein
MSPQEEPKDALAPQDPELESTDGGWDPYVASLLMSGGAAPRNASDEDDSAPVMSLSRGSKDRVEK